MNEIVVDIAKAAIKDALNYTETLETYRKLS